MTKEKKERKLTEAEQTRRADFEKLVLELSGKGYSQHLLTIDAGKANMLSIVTPLPFVILIMVGFILYNGMDALTIDILEYFLVILGFVLSVVPHELLHGLAWAYFSKKEGGWKNISFGFIRSSITPYCTCNKPMSKFKLIIAAFLPTLVLGIIPGVVSIFAGSCFWMLFSVINIFGGGGDFFIIYRLAFYKKPINCADVLFIDHPYEIGCVAFEKTI